MAEKIILEATARTGTGKGAARTARREGLVPGVIYGGGKDPQSINVKHNVLLKQLKAGHFLSTLINVKVDGQDNRVVCRAVQRHVVKDLPIHVDFLRLSETSKINLMIPVEFVNHDKAPGLKRGGTVTVVRPMVELVVSASNIPDHLTVDLTGLEIGDVVKAHDVAMPQGARPAITDRDFVIANISAPSGLRSADAEADGEEAEAE
ncbi:50S ribosomal protein L25/general stress protein Ctc [Paroceanicella profunda]|uniref:Large ribosomal subunit protein bL25 n=1 Tax=Paroceanicella profunda TaxID=2579971 RepID=A0A5B8FS24_9RHOB|nr:50S ribosomal protein L25/general stress protein Ctc [Paroceanicella profunda]QDL91566.1 50S ribosomal protein L25/general stress protein Ctc [Paroceanicella profunda]